MQFKDNFRSTHTFTRDFLTNEIFRRAEPNGRTFGEYLRQDQQYGFNIHIGTKLMDYN